MKRTPLRRGAAPTRRTPLARISRKRRERDRRWQSVRRAVIERDRGCVARQRRVVTTPCWGTLEVHHLVQRSLGGTDHATNLVAVCSAHHSFIHDHVEWAHEVGLLRRSTD